MCNASPNLFLKVPFLVFLTSLDGSLLALLIVLVEVDRGNPRRESMDVEVEVAGAEEI